MIWLSANLFLAFSTQGGSFCVRLAESTTKSWQRSGLLLSGFSQVSLRPIFIKIYCWTVIALILCQHLIVGERNRRQGNRKRPDFWMALKPMKLADLFRK